jgi:hypothetical protein
MAVEGKSRDSVFAGDSPIGRHLARWDRDIPQEKRTYGVKVCLAGGEGKSFRDGLYRVGVRHLLASYLYMRNWLKKHSVEEIEKDLGRFDYLILDSGGFTLLKERKKNPDFGVKMDVREYAEEYYTELKRIGHLFSMCAEVDLPSEVGVDYGEAMKRELISGGVPIVPVMQGQPIEYFKKLKWFDNFPYIAIGSAVIGKGDYKGWLRDVFKIGKENGNIFHGFGATAEDVLFKGQFYSVDSTTWIDGGKYGTTMIYENGRIRYYDMESKSIRKKYKRMFEENGIVFADIMKDKAFEVNMMNAVAWRQLGEGLKYDVRNSYWLTEEEREAATTIKESVYNKDGLIDRSQSIARAQLRRSNIKRDPRRDDRIHEPINCSTCFFEGKCPRYKPGAPCGFDMNLQIESEIDLHRVMKSLVETAYGRVMNGVLFEKLHGGSLDKNVSAELKNLVGIVKDLRDVYMPKKGGSQEEDGESFTLSGKATSKGVLSQMLSSVFGADGDSKDGEVETINVTPEESREE